MRRVEIGCVRYLFTKSKTTASELPSTSEAKQQLFHLVERQAKTKADVHLGNRPAFSSLDEDGTVDESIFHRSMAVTIHLRETVRLGLFEASMPTGCSGKERKRGSFAKTTLPAGSVIRQ